MQSQSRRFTFFLASITSLTSISIDMSLPAVPAIERDFSLVAGHGSLTLSLFLAGYALTPLAGGPLADRFGRRPVLIVSLALFAAAALACTLAQSFTMLLVCRLLQGCASGVSVALPLAIVRDLVEGQAARQRISEVTMVNALMPILAPIFGSWVMLLGSWRWLFGTQAAFAGIVILLVVFDFKESLAPERRQGLHPARLARNYWLLITHRQFLGYSLIYALNFACIFSFIAVSPLILMQTEGVSRHLYTLLFAAIAMGTILGSFASGVLNRRRLPVKRIITAGMLLMTVASFTGAGLQLAGLHRPWFVLPPVFLALFCFGLTAPAVTLEALEPVPHLAGSGSGAIRSLQMIFGSAASGLLAAFCARSAMRPEIAATLTMSVAVAASASLYFVALRGQETMPPEAG
ncbi:MFS transporter, DHA1 family, bicyclomycin/chloramphenicol resistance protein [Granulicella rosea]|uniref:MFS transporter, DHA1 family, bicyclomycin/chloramphenicol resistance protein n=1 Tax=Granulicella rosea TaxID=474952 RepID=A0A239LBS9_9BACT|nr:multidrug effflux MFS transporter [Granulicella rosea]SNT27089.1 MFS transporter, DHA1 family, bicyclomycin/chloramphenicol resistance protein [Granulicella rosea]